MAAKVESRSRLMRSGVSTKIPTSTPGAMPPLPPDTSHDVSTGSATRVPQARAPRTSKDAGARASKPTMEADNLPGRVPRTSKENDGPLFRALKAIPESNGQSSGGGPPFPSRRVPKTAAEAAGSQAARVPKATTGTDGQPPGPLARASKMTKAVDCSPARVPKTATEAEALPWRVPKLTKDGDGANTRGPKTAADVTASHAGAPKAGAVVNGESAVPVRRVPKTRTERPGSPAGFFKTELDFEDDETPEEPHSNSIAPTVVPKATKEADAPPGRKPKTEKELAGPPAGPSSGALAVVPVSTSGAQAVVPSPPSGALAVIPRTTTGTVGATELRRRKLRKAHLVNSAPDPFPPIRVGPPPEDGLSGANTNRSISLATARQEDSPKNEVMTVAVRAGLQPRVYMEGQQFMKDRIQDIQDELDRVQCRYHETQRVDEDEFIHYLKTCDKHFLQANTELRKRFVTLEVIDSESRLVSLLNQLREIDDADQETIQYLTEYWENIKAAVDGLQLVLVKFQNNVLNRLKKNYTSSQSGDTHLEMCSGYTEDISTHMAEMEQVLANTQIVLKSFQSGLYQNLFDSSSFVDMVLVSCDLKAFPILRLVADVAIKLTRMCDIANMWLARDQQFMEEIHLFIREARHRTKKREADLQTQKEKRKKYEKSLKAANILLHNNRDKLARIEEELQTLERQMGDNERDKRSRLDQLTQKESMVDFLKITLSQTKRNYNLQTKRSKLSRQVKDLQQLLLTMENDLQQIQTEIQAKAQERERLSEKVEHGEKSYDALKGDMERFSSNLQRLESEVTDLSSQLLQLEIIHNLKTSPEKVDEIYDRPSTVKLAPSLKEKIKERKRKITPK